MTEPSFSPAAARPIDRRGPSLRLLGTCADWGPNQRSVLQDDGSREEAVACKADACFLLPGLDMRVARGTRPETFSGRRVKDQLARGSSLPR